MEKDVGRARGRDLLSTIAKGCGTHGNAVTTPSLSLLLLLLLLLLLPVEFFSGLGILCWAFANAAFLSGLWPAELVVSGAASFFF
jgi:hypothetical protein